MRRLLIVGSTGSIGTQALDVVSRSDALEVVGLAAGHAAFGWHETRYWAPDLAVEVLSTYDVWKDVLTKTSEYFDAGVREVWVVDPRRSETAQGISIGTLRRNATHRTPSPSAKSAEMRVPGVSGANVLRTRTVILASAAGSIVLWCSTLAPRPAKVCASW